jgi:DNA-binding beta-propeller fold protein YncE
MFKHLLVSLSLLALLAGCASPAQPLVESSPETAGPASARLTGNWEGTVVEPNTSYPIRLVLEECTEGSACGKVDYPTFGCGGSLTLDGTEASGLIFTEIIEYGQNQCFSGSTIKAIFGSSRPDTITLGWFAPDGSKGPTAEVRRVGEFSDLPAQAPAPTQVVIEGFGAEIATLQGGWFIPWMPSVGFGSLWIPSSSKGTVERIDMATNQLVASVAVGKPARADFGIDPMAIAITDDSVWVTQRADKSLGRIDPSTNQLVESIPIGVQAYDIAFDGETLWVTAFEESSVARVDTKSGQVVAMIAVSRPSGIAVGGEAVWVVERSKGMLARIDPAMNKLVAEIRLGTETVAGMYPENVVFAFDSVWAADHHGMTVSRIDPKTNQKTVISLPMEAGRVSAGGGYVWVSLWPESDPSKVAAVAKIDPATGEVIETMPFAGLSSVIYFGGELWIVDNGYERDRPAGDVIHRIRLEP